MKGEIPIYLRITVDGTPKELSIKRSCGLNLWNPHAGRAFGTKEDTKALNHYLDTYQTIVFEAKRKLVEGNQMVTASAIKDLLMGLDQRNKMLIKIFEDYNDDVKKLIGIDYSKSPGQSMIVQKDLHRSLYMGGASSTIPQPAM